MKQKLIIPMLAGVIAAGMITAPAQAGDGFGRDNRVEESQSWQDQDQVNRKRSERLEQWQTTNGDKRSQRAERRAQRQAERNARRNQISANRANGGGHAGGAQYSQGASINQSLSGWGFDQPLLNSAN